MTNLGVTLSQALQNQLTYATGGTFAYAVYFDTTGANPTWTTLVDNGVVQASGVALISLPDPMVSGKVYFIVQSTTPSEPLPLPSSSGVVGQINIESDINSGSALANDYRYDSFEVNLQSAVGDAGNLTSVNGFGLAMDLSVSYSNAPPQTRGYAATGASIFDQIGAIDTADPESLLSTFTQGPLATVPVKPEYRDALSPTTAVGETSNTSFFQASNWNSYLSALQSFASDVVISGFYNGSPSVNTADPTGPEIWHNAGYYAYQLSYGPGDAFFLSALPSSQIKGTIQITSGDLANSIYSTLGTATIWDLINPQPFLNMNTGADNQWGEVFTHVLTGFTAGYYGAIGNPLNGPVALNQVDLNKSINWDPTYAFGHNLASVSPDVYYDEYAKVFFSNSNSYGSGYSDNLMAAYSAGGPLISVYDSGLKQNVAEIDITLYADLDTPSGYTQPVIYNALGPGAGGYQLPSQAQSTTNVVLSMSNLGMILKDGSPITVDIFNGFSGTGSPQWLPVALSGASLWNQWDFSYSDGAWSAVANTIPQPAGSILLQNFPTASDGVAWYRIHVGEKVFNFYTTTQGGQFLNPAYAGQQSADAIDGLAIVQGAFNADGTANPLGPSLTVGFFNNSTSSLDPSLLETNTDPTYVSTLQKPASPVAGVLNGIKFSSFAHQTQSGQTADTENDITITHSKYVAFAWTGENGNANTASWTSGYTNKLGAQNYALLFFNDLGGGADPGPLTAHADIDGKWQTDGEQKFTNDVEYAAYFVEYADATYSTPLGPASIPIVFTIQMAKAPIGAADDSDTVSYSDSTPGMIIDLQAQLTWDGTKNDVLSHIDNAIGSRFDDRLYGNDGDNVLDGGPGGADSINGGGGNDTVNYESSAAGVIIDLIAQKTWDGTVNDTLSSIENAVGSSFNDKIYGDGGDNILNGGTGGADSINGGAGNDTVSYAGSNAGVIIDLIAQKTWDGTANDILSSIENAIGSSFNDKIYGDGGDNILNGGAGGADIINGGTGNDTVSHAVSNAGVIIDLIAQMTWDGIVNDTLSSIENAVGSSFNDVIYGNGGNNILNGGPGADTLSGSGGNDVFVFQRGMANGDVIADFSTQGVDQLKFVGYGAAAQGASLSMVDATHWSITSADGQIQEVITLANGASVHPGDYLFV